MQKIKNNVIGSEKIEWRKLQWFQGKLKNLSESNLQKLKNSLKKGFISGFKATYLNDQLFILERKNKCVDSLNSRTVDDQSKGGGAIPTSTLHNNNINLIKKVS